MQETVLVQPAGNVIDVQTSGVSWAAIAGGAVAAAAVTLVLLAFGAGLGLSSVSPWADSGVSATTFKIGTGIYLCVVAVMASAVGGYLAARLRTRWQGFHTNEVFFRDTAHGLLAWALATLLLASVLGSATGRIVGGASQAVGSAAGQAASAVSPADLSIDRLFRPADTAAGAGQQQGQPAARADREGIDQATRAEVMRLWTAAFRDRNDLAAADRSYLARLIAERTGLTQDEAERRVTQVVTEAKAAADSARKAAAQAAFWLTASLLLGAFAASLAAVEGGQLRDGTWNGRVLTPRPL